MTGSRILLGMKERDDRDDVTKAKKTNSGAAPHRLALCFNKAKTPSIPVTPKRSSLRVRFQHTPIDLTRATGSGSQKDSENESFLSILGSSDDEEYRPLHGNRTPQGSGWPGGDAGAPVPVYGMFLRIRKKSFRRDVQAKSVITTQAKA